MNGPGTSASAGAPLLRIDQVHHKIALFPSSRAGVQHVNHQVESVDDVMRAWYMLKKLGVPIAFVGSGERPEDLESFQAERLVSRVLGMGDVLSLIEQAEQAFEKDQAEKAAEKLLEGEFTLDDFLEQMQAVKKMGPISNLLGMMPGMPKELKGAKIEDDQLKRVEAIIRSMTPDERRKPEIINGSRRLRIANGSGTSTGEVNRLVKQFSEMQKMMKRFGGSGGKKGKRRMPMMPPGFPGMN